MACICSECGWRSRTRSWKIKLRSRSWRRKLEPSAPRLACQANRNKPSRVQLSTERIDMKIISLILSRFTHTPPTTCQAITSTGRRDTTEKQSERMNMVWHDKSGIQDGCAQDMCMLDEDEDACTYLIFPYLSNLAIMQSINQSFNQVKADSAIRDIRYRC